MRNNLPSWKLTLLVLLAYSCPALASANEYVGSGRCASCHQQAYADWQLSDHYKAMAVASAESVLGDFANRQVNFHNIDSRFTERNGKFYIETTGADKKQHEYLISYTFGHYPLQQYLVETDSGHLQALNIALSTMSAEVPFAEIDLFTSLISEYRKSLAKSIDMPSTQTALGNLETNLGNLTLAEKAFTKALAIEPGHVPALLNLADLYRASSKEELSMQFLLRALNSAPDSSTVNFSYGLSLVRQKKYKDALPYLKAATEQEDSQSRYAYVYAVALDSIAQTANALIVLEQATNQWPNQFDLLMTQVLYMEKLNKTGDILAPLWRLNRIAPDAPGVRSRIALYIQR